MAAKPNYKFDKRQRDLAKKKQQDEKRLKKRAKSEEKSGTDVHSTAPADDVGDSRPPDQQEPQRG